MIDVDHFKPFNDNRGHLAGDRCLIQIAGVLARYERRPLDIVARFGPEPIRDAVEMRALLDEYGFKEAESLCTEWRPISGTRTCRTSSL